MVQKELGRSRGRPREFAIEDALDRAVEVFWRKGYDASSLDDLTSAMGINRPSLYAAFGDKAALFSRCIDRYNETVTGPLLLALGNADLQTALMGFLRRAAGLAAGSATPSGCLIACVLPTPAGAVPALQTKLGAAIAGLQEAVAQRLARAVKDQQLPEDFPVEDRASVAVDFILANAVRARAGTPRETLAEHVLVCVMAILAT